ncbi:MAG: hypothetical protein JW888_06245 [Pirellulales bacterium]|nr:hypothetical protein [Pirellulales bacterium]
MMKVHVEVQFDSPDKPDWADMQSLGRSVINDPKSVKVSAVEGRPRRLAVEFTMRTEPQIKAVDKIDRAMRIHGGNRLDSGIGFPKSEAELARAERKAERRRANRRARGNQRITTGEHD